MPSANLSRETYTKAIVPIGGLFALTLWMSNAAYLYLSVSFIQVSLNCRAPWEFSYEIAGGFCMLGHNVCLALT